MILVTGSSFARKLSATSQTLSTTQSEQLTTVEPAPVSARLAAQQDRLNDPAYRQFADSLTMPQALAIYTEVLTKLHQLYADHDRAQVERLYRGSLNELTAALANPTFPTGSEVLSPVIRAAAIGALKDPQAARDAVKALALTGHKMTGVSVGLIVLECAAGACAELDAYTSYMYPTPGAISEVVAPALAAVDVVRDAPDQPLIGYIRVSHFMKTMPAELDTAISQLRLAGTKSLVLDLRGVPGGSFVSAVHSADRFLTSGTIASTRGQQNGSNKVYAATGNGTCDLPMVVLVDNNTASAAEVMAAALKDRDRAVLIGQSTFGKSAVQQVIPLEAGGQLRITVARLFDPHGRSYQDNGVAPNVIESNPERQFEMALLEAAKLAARKTS